MSIYTTRKTCRVCDGDLETILNLGNLYVSTFSENPNGERAPVDLTKCNKCGLAQLRDTVDPNYMYSDYWYKSGLNNSMRDALKNVVDSIEQRLDGFYHGDIAVDIGANDGTMLKNYPDYVKTVAFEPSKLASEIKADAVVNYFFNADSYFARVDKKATIITAIAMLYDLEDPRSFLKDVKSILADGGVFVAQFTDLLCTLRLNDFSNLCLGEDELIVTESGLRPIKSIEVGDKVLTHAGRFRPVVEKFQNKAQKDKLLKLKSYGAGFDLTVTHNHPIWVNRNNVWGFVRADELVIGDIVGKPVVDEAPNYEGSMVIDTNICKIIGYYLSEGSYNAHNKAVTFYFNKNEEFTLVQDLIEALSASGFRYSKYYNESCNVCYVTSTSHDLALWLKDNFDHIAYNKSIPMWVLSLPNDQIETILLAYFDGDGYSYRNNKYYRASTVSENLAHGIALLANKLGYKCSICLQNRKKQSVLAGRVINQRNVWDILMMIKPSKRIKVWMDGAIQCSRIKSIEEVSYKQPYVYNLNVDEDHTFVTAAMTVHNCHEHVEYYSLQNLDTILQSVGLKIFDVEYNNVNGGSVRIYVCHAEDTIRRIAPSVKEALNKEKTCLETLLSEFNFNVGQIIIRLQSFFQNNTKTVHVLAASTKGNTILQVLRLTDKDIQYAAEINPAKFGKRTIGSNILIIPQEESLSMKPDYYFVLAYGFINHFIEKFRDYLENGGKFIVPLPTPYILSINNGELVYEYL